MAAAVCCPVLGVDAEQQGLGFGGGSAGGAGAAAAAAAAAGAAGGGGAAAAAAPVHPIHFLYGHLHNSIRTELDALSSWVLALEAHSELTDLEARLLHLKERYHFLEQVYKYHSSVEDEVVYPALDSKVKNVTSAYSVEHQDEEYLFEHLGSLLTAAVSQTGAERTATIRELICKVAEIHITLRKHLAKEEAQLLPLLTQHFGPEEQAELVAQFLYCIPLDTVERVLSWLKPAVPRQELTELMAHLTRVIPDRLLLQLLVTWLNPAPPPPPAAAVLTSQPDAAAAAAAAPAAADAAAKLVMCPFAAGAGKQVQQQQQPADAAPDAASADTTVAASTAAAAGGAAADMQQQQPGASPWPPLRAIVLFHHSIRGAMEVFASEAAALQQQKPGVNAMQLAGLVERHRFLRSVCMFHTLSEEEVMFPEVLRISGAAAAAAAAAAANGAAPCVGTPTTANNHAAAASIHSSSSNSSSNPATSTTATSAAVLAACSTCQDEHCSEVALFEELGRLLADVRAHVRRGRTRDVGGMLSQLVDTSRRVLSAISAHMQREEAAVLPLLAGALSPAAQRSIVWHTLRAMPLRLLERVLPWLVSEVSQDDADGLMSNLRLGAPAVDQQLVDLLLRWAQRGRWPVLPHVPAPGAAAQAGIDEPPLLVPQPPPACGATAAAPSSAATATTAPEQQQQQQALLAHEELQRQPSSGWAAHDPCLFGNNTCELRLISQGGGGSNGSSPRKRQRLLEAGPQGSLPDSSSTDVTPTAAAAAAATAGSDAASGQQAMEAAAALAGVVTTPRLAEQQQQQHERSGSPAAAGAGGSSAAPLLPAARSSRLAVCSGGAAEHQQQQHPGLPSAGAPATAPPAAAAAAALTAAAAAAGGGSAFDCSPIDHIFQFHKALKRELKQLEADAAALEHVVLAACEQQEGEQQQQQQQQQQQGPAASGTFPDAAGAGGACPAAASVMRRCGPALQQLDGRFAFLWGIYRAHSKAEDEIVFPALESKEALTNVSRAYSLDHEQEEQLFHNLSAVLTAMRGAGSVSEARDSALQLRRMCAAVRASLETHVRAEEAELWPLFGEHFTVAEQQHLVGVIIGRTGAEVLQAMLPWVTGSFSEEEKDAMMDSLREATKHTMFDQWLDAVQGGAGPAAGAGGGAAGEAHEPGTLPAGEQQQQAGLDAAPDHLPLAEIAGYLAATPNSSPLPSGVGTPLPGSQQSSQQQQQQQPTPLHQHVHQQQQRAAAPPAPPPPPQTEVSGTVAESTNYVPGWEEIFNINQKQLEAAVRRVSNDPNLEPARKAYLIQNIMVSRYIVAQQRRMQAAATGGSGGGAGGSNGGAPAPAAAAAAAGGGAGGVAAMMLMQPAAAAAAAAASGAAGVHPAGSCHGHAQQQHQCCHHDHHHDDHATHQHHPATAAAPAAAARGEPAAATPTAAAAAAAAPGQACRTYADAASGVLGCQHYRRAAQLVAPCCGRVFTCRLCHDEASDHRLDRYAVSEMVCMHCSTRQPVAGSCTACSAKLAGYYCGICHLWDDEPGRAIYHCPFCNVCRRGQGLGVDFFHCMQCNACMSLSLFNTHTCRERAMEGNCPVCHEYLFDSATPIKELPCGHFLHSACFAQYARYAYTCPICCKSIGDMSVYFQMLDSLLAAERSSLPAEYADKQQSVLCQDCGRPGRAPYHWVYHACPHCRSYNTRML